MSERVAPAVELVGVDKHYRIYKQRYRSLKEVIFHRSFGEWEDRWALHGLDLSIERGQTLGIIGSNGAGKSTTLKLMGRILQPDRGEVRTRGRVAGLLELGAGFQLDYTGRENIFLNASLLGLNRTEIKRRFDDIVGFAEMEEYIDDPLRTYSSGRHMRLGFAVAVNVDPEIMLVDEVFAVGDESFQVKCLEWMDSFKTAGGTIVMVSHQLEAVRQLCSQVAWIDHGNLRRLGEPQAVCDAYVDWVREGMGQGAGLHVVEDDPHRPPLELGPVRLLDGGGEPTAELSSGSSLTVEIPYRLNRPVAEPVFSVAIHRNDGLHVYGVSTAEAGVSAPELQPGGLVKLTFPRLSLLSGTYRVSVVIHGVRRHNAMPLDSHWQRYTFRVVSAATEEGLVRLDHEWTFGQSQARLGEAGA
jgi:ABC-type polysaccharide/polyol phosphate transport system ATPase subunit